MRKIFSEKNLHPNISKQVLEYHKAVINEVEEAIAEKQIVIVGMRWNDAVWQARRNFRKAGKKVWWRCNEVSEYEWQNSPANITKPDRKLGYCPYYIGRRK